MEMTKTEIINKLKSDGVFAVGFALDNNFEGVRGAIFEKFGYTTASRKDLRAFILNKLKSGEAQKAIQAVQSAKYLPDAGGYLQGSYTIGFGDYFASFRAPQPAGTPTTRGFLNDFLTGLGAGLTAYSNAAGTAASGAEGGVAGATSGLTQSEIDAINAKIKEDEEAAKKKKTIIIISCVAGGLIIIGVIIYFVRKNKK